MRILIVDDENSIRLTLAANLELAGFEVVEASSGAAALELIEREPFDLVLTDIRMPGMSGVDLFRRVRQIRLDLPVVLMTAFAVEGLVDAAIGAGVFTVLPKPFSMEHLIAILIRAGRRPFVLVVNGEPDSAASIAASLRAAGLATRTAGEADALREIRGEDVDVCVIDATSPDAGAAVIEEILVEEPLVDVIALFGRSAPEAVRRVAAHRAFACMQEPIDPLDVVRVIARARGGRTPSGGAEPPEDEPPR